MLVSLKLDSDLFVIDAQVSIAVANDRLRHHLLHFLGNHADIGTIAAVITEAIVAEAVGEMAEQDDVVFDHDVGPPPATSTTTAATTTMEATSAATTEGSTSAAVEGSATTTMEAAASDVRAMAHATVPVPSMGRSMRGASARRPLCRVVPAAAGPLCCVVSATRGKLPCLRPATTGPHARAGSSTGRKLPYARPLPTPEPTTGP